jgi:hypothetical protein
LIAADYSIMSEIFVSYAREDKGFVQSLSSALKQRKRETWIDWEGILPTDKWHQEIFRAIEGADSVLFVISSHSVASKVCTEELTHAFHNNKRIIPIVRESVDDEAVPEFVRERQWIYFRESDDSNSALVSLITALDTDLEWVKAHTRLLTRAIEWDRHKRDFSFALRGSELRHAEGLLTSNAGQEPRLLPLQTDYILSSRRGATKRFSFTIGAGSLALTALLILGLFYWEKRRESALNLAANFREMGLSALGNNNPLAAEVLFARALTINNTPGARERLIEARARSPLLLWISPAVPDTTMLAVSGDGVLFAVLASASEDATVKLWQVSDWSWLRTLVGHRSGVYEIAFSPNGRFLLTASDDKTARLWMVESGKEIIQPIQHESPVWAVDISSDGMEIATGSEDSTVQLWDLSISGEVAEIHNHTTLRPLGWAGVVVAISRVCDGHKPRNWRARQNR